MGAEYIEFRIKAKSLADLKKQFQKKQEVAAYEHGNSYSGDINMADGIEVHNGVYLAENLASDYIFKTAKKWEEAIAVLVTEKEETFYLIGAWCSS